MNVDVVRPAGMDTVDGTIAAGSVEARFTTNPPVGAAELIVIVPLATLPPSRLVGLTVSESNVGGVTVKLPETDLLPNDADTVTTL